MSPDDYKQLLLSLVRKGARLTCAVVPASYDRKKGIVTWNETGIKEKTDILEILKIGQSDNIVEIACHGLTHIRPDLKPLNPIIDIIQTILYGVALHREFYNQEKHQEIDIQIQKKRIKYAIQILEQCFGRKPAVFVPPTHSFDDSTEKVLEELGIQYLSADMNFHHLPKGSEYRKNPCPIGEKSEVSDTVYLSATILGAMGTFDYTAMVFSKIGIPIVWARHIFPGDDMRAQDILKLAKLADSLDSHRYLLLSELGSLLDEYRLISLKGIVSNKEAHCAVTTNTSIILEYLVNGQSIDIHLKPGDHDIKFGNSEDSVLEKA
jgi:peptidoglycan/xylan/chitin deacetylase (PgdA/CDA1 family)